MQELPDNLNYELRNSPDFNRQAARALVLVPAEEEGGEVAEQYKYWVRYKIGGFYGGWSETDEATWDSIIEAASPPYVNPPPSETGSEAAEPSPEATTTLSEILDVVEEDEPVALQINDAGQAELVEQSNEEDTTVGSSDEPEEDATSEAEEETESDADAELDDEDDTELEKPSPAPLINLPLTAVEALEVGFTSGVDSSGTFFGDPEDTNEQHHKYNGRGPEEVLSLLDDQAQN